MPRVAFAQAFGRQQAALQGAMLLERFDSVSRAAGIKAAILAEVRADAQLVGTHQ
jgi:hypothetical protein